MEPAKCSGRAVATDVTTVLVDAEPITLHGPGLDRVDCNTPVLSRAGGMLAFVSDYHPIGHTYRRQGTSLGMLGPRERVRLLDDPDPQVGKWIESVWPDPSGRLYGWYHAEEMAPCERRLFMPSIGAIVSSDEGVSWRRIGPLLRPPPDTIDCTFDNGAVAGGYGDFSVVPDAGETWFYLHFSSYVADEAHQGVVVARYPMIERDAPAARLEVWSDGIWRPAGTARPAPIVPIARGWRHADPDAHWGPAVHFNRDLGLYVMLLNHCQRARRDWHSTGVDISFNADLADPSGWTRPRRLIDGELWYPQIVGLGEHDGDTSSGARARFFIAGFSAWEVHFTRGRPAEVSPVRTITAATVGQLFGPGAQGPASGMPPAAV